jgi:hypothetical protein
VIGSALSPAIFCPSAVSSLICSLSIAICFFGVCRPQFDKIKR